MFNSIVFLFFHITIFIKWHVTLNYYFYRKVIKMNQKNGEQKKINITFSQEQTFFKLTLTTIYANCIRRVSQKLGNKSQITVCEEDPSLVSFFFNGKITPNNRYLITKKLLDFHSNELGAKIGIVPTLKFQDNFEVLWGSKDEFDQNLFLIFYCIIKDILESNYEHPHIENRLLIQNVLFDNVTFAKYYSLYQIKRAYKLSSILPYFGVNDNLISPSSMGTYLLIALDHLFQKENFKESFSSIFYTFAKERNDYMHLDRRLEQNFLPNLFKLIEHYKPTSDSLGLLVKSHIDNDLTRSIYLLNNTVSSNAQQIAYKELIKQSSQYLAVLERNNHMF